MCVGSMGDIQTHSDRLNGVVTEERLFSPSLAHLDPDPSSIGEDCWATAEETTQEVLSFIRPTLDSEEKRKDVVEYVQRLFRASLGCEVFPYGSVPLKTYLPDGDIDLTALVSPNIEESLPHDILTVLQGEEQNENAEYEVKDTQFIDAEVKLVKCLVQNIVIDISFNQLGGLYTLCFLEQVDDFVGKNHLFKRSIILIKAWCYYESRILGAHHCLISTYALETLILYIFHLFHSSLNCPIAVLYRFLHYFSRFDWESYCISLKGPVRKSTLPDLVVEAPEDGGFDFMLSEEFLRNCMDMFSVPSRDHEKNSQTFPPKHLNIIDPLKDYNNLGRSVNRGNFYRIRGAFKYGARKLGQILLLPREKISDEIKKFFSSALERHGPKRMANIQNPPLVFDVEGSDTLFSSSHTEASSEDEMQLRSSNFIFDNESLGGKDSTLIFGKGPDRHAVKLVSSHVKLESCCSTDGTTVSGCHLAGVANDLAVDKFLSLRNANDVSDCPTLSSIYCSSLCGQCYRAPHLHFSGSSMENENLGRNNSLDAIDENLGFDSRIEHKENHAATGKAVRSGITNHEHLGLISSAISSLDANISEGLSLDFRESDLAGISGDIEPLNPLSDLSGDYDSHIRSLLYGQGCHGYSLSGLLLPNRAASPSLFQNKKPWQTVCRSVPLEQKSSCQLNTNCVVVRPSVYASSSMPISAAFVPEAKHKARGTGTYFTNNSYSCRQRPSLRQARNNAHGAYGQLQRQGDTNGLAPGFPETKSIEESGHEVPHAQSPVRGCGNSGLSHQFHHSSGDNTPANGFSDSICRLEFGSLGNLAEVSSLLASGSSYAKVSAPSPAQEVHRSKSLCGKKQERVADQSFLLKNEDDFPPLCENNRN